MTQICHMVKNRSMELMTHSCHRIRISLSRKKASAAKSPSDCRLRSPLSAPLPPARLQSRTRAASPPSSSAPPPHRNFVKCEPWASPSVKSPLSTYSRHRSSISAPWLLYSIALRTGAAASAEPLGFLGSEESDRGMVGSMDEIVWG